MAQVKRSTPLRHSAWLFMCCCRNRKVSFSAEQVADASGMPKCLANRFLRDLYREGRLTLEWKGRTGLTNRYWLNDDSPLKRQSQFAKIKASQRIWNSCRIMRNFSIEEIMVTARVARSTVKRYLNALQRAGLIRIRAVEEEMVIYHLNVDCGALAPELIDDGIYAPTKSKFYPYREAL